MIKATFDRAKAEVVFIGTEPDHSDRYSAMINCWELGHEYHDAHNFLRDAKQWLRLMGSMHNSIVGFKGTMYLTVTAGACDTRIYRLNVGSGEVDEVHAILDFKAHKDVIEAKPLGKQKEADGG